eukprot:gene36170-47027_t
MAAATTNTSSGGGLKVEFIDNSSSQYDEYADRIKFSLKTRTDKRKLGKLFIGDRYSASFLQLEWRKCKSVVNCCKEIHGLSRETDVQYLKLDPEEDEGDDSFQKSFPFIDASLEKGNNVLVHCESGLNQSAAIAIYYIMKKKDINLADSYKIVKEQRKKAIKIRPALTQKLIKAEKFLRGSISIMLDGRKVIFLDAIGKRSSGSGTSYVPYYTAFAVAAFFAVIFLGIYLATGKI